MNNQALCGECGAKIEFYYFVQLCDSCLDDKVEEKPCQTCGKMAKTHPRMQRVRLGGGKYGEAQYWCAEHVEDANQPARL